jgi:hypothetical protein
MISEVIMTHELMRELGLFSTQRWYIIGNLETLFHTYVVVSVCVSRSDDRVTGILANSVCWWNHPLDTPQLMEVAVVGSVSPFACVCVCVCVLVVRVLPCPEFIIAALLGNWLPSPRLDRSRLRSLLASPVIGATNT